MEILKSLLALAAALWQCKGMRAIGLFCLSLVLTGCATKSRYANDPRARCVGPAYLDYIEQHPPEKSTEYYYPAFILKGGNYVETALPVPPNPPIQALLTVRPTPTPEVVASTRKGWPKLEASGMPFDCE